MHFINHLDMEGLKPRSCVMKTRQWRWQVTQRTLGHFRNGDQSSVQQEQVIREQVLNEKTVERRLVSTLHGFTVPYRSCAKDSHDTQ